MSEVSSATSPGPETPRAGAQGDLAAKPERPQWRKILTPVALAVLGLVLFLFTILSYPSGATGVATPLYSRLAISTTFPILEIGLVISQVSPDVAEVGFSIELPAGRLAPPANAPTAHLTFAPPIGITFLECPAPACHTSPSEWRKPLAFTTGRAQANFFVKANSFGVAFNGVNASAAIPEVLYHGPGAPILFVGYSIPSAASYDWSSFPTAAANNTSAFWQEDLTGSDTAGRAAVGINPSGQANHDTRVFIAGALVGLAGAAILSAVQEAFHAFD
jgi:hypothetical protein